MKNAPDYQSLEWTTHHFPDYDQEASRKLAEAIRIATVAGTDHLPDGSNPNIEMRSFLRGAFPLVERSLRRDDVGEYAIVFTWEGTEPRIPPVVFTAHWDVVGITDASRSDWTYPPFSGHIDDRYVWGRGTLDDKISLVGLLEAVERLLSEGYRPVNTLVFAFGGDEEIDGAGGAAAAADLVRRRFGRISFLVDEGSLVIERGPGRNGKPLGLIGVAEKGYANVRLSVRPDARAQKDLAPEELAQHILARAVRRVERRRFPSRIIHPVRRYLRIIGGLSGMPRSLLLRNTWLTGVFVRMAFRSNAAMNALFRTTVAVTASARTAEPAATASRRERENTGSGAPPSATSTPSAILNLRILPGDSTTRAMRRLRRAIADPRVTIELVSSEVAGEPVSGTRLDSVAYKIVESAAGHAFPGAVCAPYLVTGSTDSKHYRHLTRHIFRFTPVMLPVHDLRLIHGTNERVSHDNVVRALAFYRRLIVLSGNCVSFRR